jgi:hypothetical protein
MSGCQVFLSFSVRIDKSYLSYYLRNLSKQYYATQIFFNPNLFRINPELNSVSYNVYLLFNVWGGPPFEVDFPHKVFACLQYLIYYFYY